MYAGPALRLKVGPVMPGTPACAGTASSETNAAAAPRSRRPTKVFVFVSRMSALLDAGATSPDLRRRVERSADVDLGHHAAEVLGVVRQVVEIRRVQIELASRRILRRAVRVRAACVENHVKGLAAAKRDRVRVIAHVVTRRITQQPRIDPD